MDFLYGLVPLTFVGYTVITFGLVQLMFLGITLYLHRDQAHGGLVLHPALRHFFRFWLWFCSGTNTKQWVAVHRRHHAYADRPGDPHSPVVFGLSRVLLEGYELYAAAARDPAILAHYGCGTPDDWLERNLYSRYPRAGIVCFITVQVLLFGVPAIAMVGVQMLAQPLFAAGIINGLGHAVGYRSFEMPAAATNIVPWGVLIGGEELHNNHHAFPSSARFAVQPWEIDIGWAFICVFRALGLAQVRKVAPKPTVIGNARGMEQDSMRALFANRMHVLRDYGRRVIRPVFRELMRRDRGTALAQSSPKILIRHSSLLDERALQQRNELLQRYEVLRVVMDFHERLQRIWNQALPGRERALVQLRELCAEAEASGIEALREFANRLRAYVPEARST